MQLGECLLKVMPWRIRGSASIESDRNRADGKRKAQRFWFRQDRQPFMFFRSCMYGVTFSRIDTAAQAPGIVPRTRFVQKHRFVPHALQNLGDCGQSFFFEWW